MKLCMHIPLEEGGEAEREYEVALKCWGSWACRDGVKDINRLKKYKQRRAMGSKYMGGQNIEGTTGKKLLCEGDW